MSFIEEGSENDGCTENISYSKLPYSKITHGSISTIHSPQGEGEYVKSLSQVNVAFEKAEVDQTNLKSGHIRQITRWRRAITEDSPAIKHLQTLTGDVADILYRKQNIDELIEKSYFPVVQLDSKGELISFTAYDPYPNIPSVPSFFWREWLTSTYRLKGVGPRNALFVHYMVWQPHQAKQFLPLLLQTSFTEFLHLEHIIIVKPPHANVRHPLFILFQLEQLCEYVNRRKTIINFVNKKITQKSPQREEEFDTIVPFIKNHMDPKDIGDDSGSVDFVNFIYNEEKKTLLCEFEGKVVGLMVLNLKLDLDSLSESFELSAFNELRKKDSEYDEKCEVQPNILPQHSSTKINDRPNIMLSSEFLFSKMKWELSLSKGRENETSSLNLRESSDSLFSTSDFSGLSLGELSLVDVKSSDVEFDYSQKISTALTIHSRNGFCNKPVDVKMKMRTSLNGVPRFYLPKFKGPSNAFLIDFFAIDNNKLHEKLSSFEFLTAAFETIPDRDYCVLIIPTDLLPFPLLDLFVRVTPKLMTTLKQELYLCHKNSLVVKSMIVRNATKEDLTPINKFLQNLTDWDKIYGDILNSFLLQKEFQTFVLTIGEKIIGVSLTDNFDSFAHLNCYFDVTNYTELKELETQRIIKHLILNPIYHCHARFFVRDILRLSDLKCLYYIYNEYNKNEYEMISILGELIPVKPKRKIDIYDHNHLNIGNNGNLPPISLHMMNSQICGFTKFHINIVIVVVGASRTAISFLENLIFGETSPFVIYNNLICVTPQALDLDGAEDIKHTMFPIRDNCSKKYLAMLSLETHVSFIYGIMTAINRSEKYIVVNNKVVVKYDYLILTCGLQYLTPVPKARELPKNRCKKFHKSSLARFLFRSESIKKNITPRHPLNMFVINTNGDAKNALYSLQRLMHKIKSIPERKIIVYGYNLHSFLTINTLLKLGVPGEVIVFVEPFISSGSNVAVFNDSQVDQAVLESIKNLKISHYKEYFLYDWTVASEDYITSITFHSKRKQVVIPCLAFFPFVKRLVSDVTFRACSDAGLVYDGRLIINHNFKTNDDYIYAAGPFTKYSRRYYANDQDHQFYNSTEVGQKLANILKSKIDPTVDDIGTENSDLVPQMKAPVLICCQLPGDLNFLVLRKPGKEMDLQTAYNFENYGEVLTTGDCKMLRGYGYFRLHLDAQGFVESIICATKDRINHINMYSLYGLHERFLNNLLVRYDLGLIPDFYAYFRQPWAVALYHENFPLLREQNLRIFEKTLLKGSEDNFAQKILKRLVQNKWQTLPESLKRRIRFEYFNSKIETEIKNNVLQFLEFYNTEFPMYAVPSVVHSLLRSD